LEKAVIIFPPNGWSIITSWHMLFYKFNIGNVDRKKNTTEQLKADINQVTQCFSFCRVEISTKPKYEKKM